MKPAYKIFIVLILVLTIMQAFILITMTNRVMLSYKKNVEFTGKASGYVRFCINTPPGFNLTSCSTNATQDINYQCWINGTDPDQNVLTHTSAFRQAYRACNASTAGFFNVTQQGLLNFTPSNNDVGNYTIEFMVDDGMGCSNSVNATMFNLRVLNVNDLPYLIRSIPDQTLHSGEILHAFYLNDYITDPDCADRLNYTVVLLSPEFNVMVNSFTSEVVITANVCDVTGYVMFNASDPYGAWNTSNLVMLSCITETPVPEAGVGEGTGTGGGAGTTRKCIPEYDCFDYTSCRKNNTKVMRCVDTKGCDYDKFITVPCKYEPELVCNESWDCSEWGACLPNGTQYRECTDLNNCGTRKSLPPLSQPCTYIGTCDDGIKNCHDGSCEEGIDCGGPCSACKSIQVPYPFVEERGILIYLVTGIILLLLTAVLLYHYFRKEIDAALAKAGWIITRRKKKQILLSSEDKKKLLAGIAELEKKLGSQSWAETLNKYSELISYYLVKACGDKSGLGMEFDLEELKQAVDKSKARLIEILRKIFISSFAKCLKVEQDKALVNKRNITLLIEELRNLVLQTSIVEAEDVEREVKSFDVPEKASNTEKIIILITNAYIALQFLELEVAKKKYLDLLAEYGKMSMNEQEAVFEDVSRLYNNISYVNAWLAKPKETLD